MRIVIVGQTILSVYTVSVHCPPHPVYSANKIMSVRKFGTSLFSSLLSAGDASRSSRPSSTLKFCLMIASLLSLFSLISTAMAANTERTFIMVKPDGVQRGLVGKIIERFEQKGFKLVAMKFMWVSVQ